MQLMYRIGVAYKECLNEKLSWFMRLFQQSILQCTLADINK